MSNNPYTVGLANESGSVLGRFATEEAASKFISTLEGHEDGRYYLDGQAEELEYTGCAGCGGDLDIDVDIIDDAKGEGEDGRLSGIHRRCT